MAPLVLLCVVVMPVLPVQQQMQQGTRQEQHIRQEAEEMSPVLRQQKKSHNRQKGTEHNPETS